ncbi:MAG: glycoside hydrolase family 43 protein [Chitinophagaceae bacterium]|nr:glycoside hydrolase family 43 protein [Chitinophagaceae bacterium]
MEIINIEVLQQNAISKPLVTHIYTADPSAHVFEGKIYIYCSHDIDAGDAFDDLGSHFAMEDYHVLRMDHPDAPAVDEGVALHIKEVPWAAKQMWAPDAAEKNGVYYLYFPAKDKEGIFRIGVATSSSPAGPFAAEPQPIPGSFSIDPAVFKDDDGSHYIYFGGIWGGQLQRWRNGTFNPAQPESPFAFLPENDEPALCAKVARLKDNMLEFAEPPADVVILDENGKPLLQGDNNRRFFEAPWMHKYNGKYYFSYSTGDTHFLCYAIGDNPYGPFTYAGRILEPVVGWTTHHSICAIGSQWYLFYHDSLLSGGVTHLRSVKCTPLYYDNNGKIITIKPYGN